MHRAPTLRGPLLAFVAVLCGIALLTSGVTAAVCPEIEAQLTSCSRYNRTMLLSELCDRLALPGDPAQCLSTSRLASAYAILIPPTYKTQYGSQFDDRVFANCDGNYDGWFCVADIEPTKCTCVVDCDMLFMVRVMIESIKVYPYWATTGVPRSS